MNEYEPTNDAPHPERAVSDLALSNLADRLVDMKAPPADDVPRCIEHPWMFGRSGERIDLTNPYKTPIRMSTLSNVLANVNRFGGHATGRINVARHSVFVAYWLLLTSTREAARMGLVHDAHEAYTGDCPSPMKAVLGDAWLDFEASWAIRVRDAFGMQYDHDLFCGAVKHADLVALTWERERYLPPAPAWDEEWPLVAYSEVTAAEVVEKSGLSSCLTADDDARLFRSLARDLNVRSVDDGKK